MNTKEKAKDELLSFIGSDKRCILVTGTHQYEKHMLVMKVLNESYSNQRILFRINSLSNITGNSFLGKIIKKQPKAGEYVKVGRNKYSFDSFTNKGTWGKAGQIDIAIIYPIDAIARKDVKLDCINELFEDEDIKKIFLVSWTDAANNYDIFNRFIDARTAYDAEEEDIEYHNRVLDLINNSYT